MADAGKPRAKGNFFRSEPPVANYQSKSRRNWPDVTPQIGRNRAGVAQVRPRLARDGAGIGQSGSRLAGNGAKVGQCCRNRAKLGQVRQQVAKIVRDLARAAQNRPRFAQTSSDSHRTRSTGMPALLGRVAITADGVAKRVVNRGRFVKEGRPLDDSSFDNPLADLFRRGDLMEDPEP